MGGELTREHQFYVSSLEASPERPGEIIRANWGVENGLHWVLDAQLREDDCSVAALQGAENLAAMQRCALVLLQRDPPQIPNSRATFSKIRFIV